MDVLGGAKKKRYKYGIGEVKLWLFANNIIVEIEIL